MKVCCLVDSSEISLNAFKYYLEKIHKPENQVHVFHAILQPNLPSIVDLRSVSLHVNKITEVLTDFNKKEDELRVKIENMFNCNCDAKETYHKHDNKVDTASFIGPAAVEYATTNQIDMIVCGSRGLTGIKKHWLGSVSDYCLRNATCSVMISRS